MMVVVAISFIRHLQHVKEDNENPHEIERMLPVRPQTATPALIPLQNLPPDAGICQKQFDV